MPGPFFHIYTARRVADFLASSGGFTRDSDGVALQAVASADKAAYYSQVMQRYPKLTSLGALGPDLFFFLGDLRDVDGDEFMTQLRLLYLTDRWKEDDWAPLLALLKQQPYAGAHPWVELLRFIIELDQLWTKFTDKYLPIVAPVVDGIAQAADVITGDMLSAFREAVGELRDDLLGHLAQAGLDTNDFFSYFRLILDDGSDEASFFWSDMLHYRRTSQMGRVLLSMAEAMIPQDHDRGEQLLAYALGFACHLGTDVVGHAFVNEQCGGPFRTHWQRHHVIENHMDAWCYDQTRPGGVLPADAFCAATPDYPSLAGSALYFSLQLTPEDPQGELRRPLPDDTPPHGYSLTDQLATKAALDVDGELPDWLAQSIVRALIQTYQNGPTPRILRGGQFQTRMDAELEAAGLAADPPLDFTVPEGFPLPWQIQVTYKLMLSFFKRSFADSFDLAIPPQPGVDQFHWPDFSNLTGLDTTSPDSFFQSLAADVGQSLGDVMTSISSLLDSLLGVFTLPTREEIYKQITYPAWLAARRTRQAMVHTGYLMPQGQVFDKAGRLRHPNEIDQDLVSLGASGHTTTGLGQLDFPWLPVQGEYHRPWGYPSSNIDGTQNSLERAATRGGPFETNAMPDVLLHGDRQASNALRLKYELSATPEGTDSINASDEARQISNNGSSPLGDCLMFSAYLIGRLARPGAAVADFNLDADRGYGYLCWDWNRDTTAPPWTLHGHTFAPPKGWQQSPLSPNSPLTLHYTRTRTSTNAWLPLLLEDETHLPCPSLDALLLLGNT